MLVLYDVALSPYAQKVKMALIEKGLPYEIRNPALGAADAAFTAANPRQEVPALLDDGFAVFDSSVILEYLEDKWPVPALRPEGAAERARLRMIQEICDTQWEAVNWAMAEIRVMNRAEGAAAEHILAQAARDLAGLRRWLARELGGHGWFGGERFGLADIAVFPYVMGSSFQKEGPEAGSPLADWLARMRERPSAQRVLADAKAAIPSVAKDIRDKALSGERPRQYRDHRLEFMLRAVGEAALDDGTIRFSTLPS